MSSVVSGVEAPAREIGLAERAINAALDGHV